MKFINGAIAQLVEHLHGMQGASGSSPLGSIILFQHMKISLRNKFNFKEQNYKYINLTNSLTD